jgi:hypothetical protein
MENIKTAFIKIACILIASTMIFNPASAMENAAAECFTLVNDDNLIASLKKEFITFSDCDVKYVLKLNEKCDLFKSLKKIYDEQGLKDHPFINSADFKNKMTSFLAQKDLFHLAKESSCNKRTQKFIRMFLVQNIIPTSSHKDEIIFFFVQEKVEGVSLRCLFFGRCIHIGYYKESNVNGDLCDALNLVFSILIRIAAIESWLIACIS